MAGASGWSIRRGYDRKRWLTRAARAARNGRNRKAIDLYREVLEREPGNPEVLADVAPLLALTGQRDEAWVAWAEAEETYVRQGRIPSAIRTLECAVRLLPREVRAWMSLAARQCERGQAENGLQTLIRGRSRFRGGRRRSEALALLQAARRLAPDDRRIGTDLVWQHALGGAHETAFGLIAELRVRGTISPLRRRALRMRVRLHRWASVHLGTSARRVGASA